MLLGPGLPGEGVLYRLKGGEINLEGRVLGELETCRSPEWLGQETGHSGGDGYFDSGRAVS